MRFICIFITFCITCSCISNLLADNWYSNHSYRAGLGESYLFYFLLRFARINNVLQDKKLQNNEIQKNYTSKYFSYVHGEIRSNFLFYSEKFICLTLKYQDTETQTR